MERNMTVFGFGRQYRTTQKHLTAAPAHFSFGLCDSRDKWAVAAAIAAAVPNVAAAAHRTFEQHALTHGGDAARGRELFLKDTLTKCVHLPQGERSRGRGGPDLSHIGGKFGRPHLIESLLEPSRQIVEGYRTTLIRTHRRRRPHRHREGADRRADDATRCQRQASTILPTRTSSDAQRQPPLADAANLTDQLTPEQFTDLVAYLETLRSGGKPTPGAASAGPIKLPAGFEVRTIATGLTGCTALEVAPDGRIFVCEQTGHAARRQERPAARSARSSGCLSIRTGSAA